MTYEQAETIARDFVQGELFTMLPVMNRETFGSLDIDRIITTLAVKIRFQVNALHETQGSGGANA